MTAPAAISRLATAALKYATQGWVLIPLHTAPGGVCSCQNPTCPSPGKHPRTSHGLLEASSDETTVRTWWTRWPDANIGCKPGASGYVVLDVDGPEGEATATAAGLFAEPTLVVKTGRGEHRWYRHPGGHVPNGTLGPKVDIRGDAGYVLLPPSRHPSGTIYRWEGTLAEVASLRPEIAARLVGTTTGAPGGPKPDQLPAWMIPYLDVQPGERNTTMTRFVGWAFRAGHDATTVLVMALAVSAQWPDPLARREVEAIVKSIGARDGSRPQRRTATGTTLRVANESEGAATPSLHAIAFDQVERAIAQGKLDHRAAPRWRWTALDDLLGPMLPGDLIVIGGLTGNGKTAFTMSQVDGWTAAGTTVLYVPLELDPERVRRQWAAWEAGLDWTHVARNAWDRLPPDAQKRHEQALADQAANPHIHLPPDRRIDLGTLRRTIDRAVTEVGAKVVVVDHFHRMDFGGASSNYRVQVTEAARDLKDLARHFGMPILALAQLNQDPHVLDRYFPPQLKRLKESAGLGEEADLVLMLSRRLRHELDAEVVQSIRSGHADLRDYEDRGVMVVTCRKSRLVDDPRDQHVRLMVRSGKVEELPREWATIRDPRWEP